ncbi:MAG: MgtC/SapB family protein [Phycisphaeraceae bacterium]|nr:MgtC/SapB family protein [Phycisphaerales bacterium]MCB9843139.1 MgtC/SapB family protein [Phycisphaeraceae bacterium]
MDLVQAFEALGIALASGMLVGIQRERGGEALAGIRTFPLIALVGAMSAMLHTELGAWPIVVAGLGVIASMVMGNIFNHTEESPKPGITTEVAILVTFLVGVMLGTGMREIPVAIAAVTALLLHAKKTLHRMVDRMGDHDVMAILQFAVITFVVLPILPDRTMGPLGVLNPREIWLMVVLVVGLSLAGYVAYRLLGERHGNAVAGLLGGLISSTATTVAFAKRERDGVVGAWAAAVAITLASSIAFIRVIVEIGVVAPEVAKDFAVPFAMMFGMLFVLGAVMLFKVRGKPVGDNVLQQKNPSELKAAILFGAMYAVVLLAVAAANKWAGNEGVYAVAAFSGLTDMDAITLSTARNIRSGDVTREVGGRAILLASMANLVFKGGFVVMLGRRDLAMIVATVFGATMLLGAGLMFFWAW